MSSEDGKTKFEQRYLSGNIPWDIGRPDYNLKEIVKNFEIPRGRALDIGCGTGDNAIYLARKGFDVVGIDLVEYPIKIAKEKLQKCEAECTFLLRNFMNERIPGGPFSFVFDRGCFHSFDDTEDRKKFAEQVFEYLLPEGYWLSLIGNADEKRLGPGPPRRSALEIVQAVEPYFEILLLKSGRFDSNSKPPPMAWILLLRRR